MSYSRPPFAVDAHAVITRSIRRWSLLGVLALLCSLLAPTAQAAPGSAAHASAAAGDHQEAPSTIVSGGVAASRWPGQSSSGRSTPTARRISRT